MCKSLGFQLEAKNVGKILKDVEACRKRFEELKALGLSTTASSGIFNEEMFRTLRAHVSPRAVVKVSHEQTVKTLENLFTQLEMILSLPDNFGGLVDRADQLAQLPPNVLAKFYLYSNSLNEEASIMHTIPMAKSVQQDIAEWTGIKEAFVRSEIFQKFLATVSSFFVDLLGKYTSNKPRCYR